MKPIKIKLHKGGTMPERHGAWYDLTLARDATIKKGEVKILPLGISMQLPRGMEALVASRSSTPLKWGIAPANGVGIIDGDYCGDDDEWGFVAVGLRDASIPAGTRIAQFRLLGTIGEQTFEEVGTLGNPNRGGFGSTGTGSE